ncbi:hypothetical protein Tco_0014384 [Tanacetum coccineum]
MLTTIPPPTSRATPPLHQHLGRQRVFAALHQATAVVAVESHQSTGRSSVREISLMIMIFFLDIVRDNGYSQKDKNKAKKDKTEHGIGRA